jgi:hypothetical protein
VAAAATDCFAWTLLLAADFRSVRAVLLAFSTLDPASESKVLLEIKTLELMIVLIPVPTAVAADQDTC